MEELMNNDIQRAILVAVNINSQKYFIESLDELEELTIACNIKPIGKMIQNLDQVNNSLYIGTGKLEEVKQILKEYKLEIFIKDYYEGLDENNTTISTQVPQAGINVYEGSYVYVD